MRATRLGAFVPSKGSALLRFLKDAAKRKRIPSYGADEKVLWFADVPTTWSECKSAFLDDTDEFRDVWLEVHKVRMPIQPVVPEAVVDWIRPEDLGRVNEEPELLPEITVLVEKEAVYPDTPHGEEANSHEKISESRRLADHPEVEDAWLEYLVNQRDPWTKDLERWQEIQAVYESIDSMRRSLEQAEERYELMLGVGLLQWRDSTGRAVKRHLLTAPAEIELDAARGILKVVPAASFEQFRIELDMLERQDRPRLAGGQLQESLEDLGVDVWDTERVGCVLRTIANQANSDAEVQEQMFEAASRVDEKFRVVYAPALILRNRRPVAFAEVVENLSKAVDGPGESPIAGTNPWERFLSEGEPSNEHADVLGDRTPTDPGLGPAPGRLYLPLPTNDEQRQIVHRLQAQSSVVVKGPPGTGKSLTIANLICHLLATGERVLVTAQNAKALRVIRGLLPEEMQALCITALGSSREDQRLLEEGVGGILRRRCRVVWNRLRSASN